MEQDQPSMLLDRVPAHVLREVFGFLGDSDLARAEATCATFRQASRSESLWRDKLADKLGDQAKIVLPETLPHERCVRARRRLRPHRISSLFFSPPRQRPSRNATRADLLLVARAGTTTATSWKSPPGRPCSSSGWTRSPTRSPGTRKRAEKVRALHCTAARPRANVSASPNARRDRLGLARAPPRLTRPYRPLATSQRSTTPASSPRGTSIGAPPSGCVSRPRLSSRASLAAARARTTRCAAHARPRRIGFVTLAVPRFFSSFWKRRFSLSEPARGSARRRLRSALALPGRASLEPRVTRARRVFTPRARSPHRLD